MTCGKIYDLGTFPNCGNLSVPVPLADGTYTVRIEIGSSLLEIESSVTEGLLSIHTSYLSVNREIILKFYQASQLITTDGIDTYKIEILNSGNVSTDPCPVVPPSAGGESLWQLATPDTIEPKENKKVDASVLVGELSGGIFQP